jgi:methylglutaconyl-CoA hydratase
MMNSIADPLVENVVGEEVSKAPVTLTATPDGVATVRLAHASSGGYDGRGVIALTEIFETLRGAEGVRIVFIRGEDATFDVGGDLDWTRMADDWSEDDNRDDAMAVGAMLMALDAIPALTVALVDGAARGLGAGLAAACDIAIATAEASFAFTEVKTGVIPAMAGPYVIRAIGPRAALALFATGRKIDAGRALSIGLIQGLVPDAAALDAVQTALIAEIKTSAPVAVGRIKAFVRHAADEPIGHALIDHAARHLARARISPEAQEALSAAKEGRTPTWAT